MYVGEERDTSLKTPNVYPAANQSIHRNMSHSYLKCLTTIESKVAHVHAINPYQKWRNGSTRS